MKWAKFAIIAIAPIVLLIGVWMATRGEPSPVPNSYNFIDVRTGDLVTLSKTEVQFIPAPNLRDGERTLFPASQNENGEWVVLPRYRGDVSLLAKSGPIKVNQASMDNRQN